MRQKLLSLMIIGCTLHTSVQAQAPTPQASAPSVDLSHGDLKVSANARYLVHADGTPFFYLADTAWELFHCLDRAEAIRYLENRQQKRFTVIQAVALAELDGLNHPNAYGDKPLLNNNPATPDTTPGADPNDAAQYDYWDHVDFIVDEAQKRGLTIGLLPTWGDKWNKRGGQGPEVFTPENAALYGEWIGRRYRAKPIIWILGGDRTVENEAHLAIMRALAGGIQKGDGGRHLITFHPVGGRSSAEWFHNDTWLSFNMQQTGHCTNTDVWNRIERDYNRTPTKPVIDGEPLYEDHPICFNAKANGYSDAYEIRKFAYWDIFAGAAGHTYGNHSIWQMHAPAWRGVNGPTGYWYDAADHPGAAQMQYVRQLIESRPYLSRVPDQSLLASNARNGTNRLQATRGDGYAFIYSPFGDPFTVQMGKISGGTIQASWFDPRQGTSLPAGRWPNNGTREFTPPASGRGNDWILVLDDESLKYAPVGPRGNLFPTVSLRTPQVVSLPENPTKTNLQAPTSITLTAEASDADGQVREIEIWEGTASVGKSTASPFRFNWTAQKPGLYTFMARVTDDKGASTTSLPINVLVGPLKFNFHRAINLNGPPLSIDGHPWEGRDAPNVTISGTGFENQNVPLNPATDAERTRMIRSSVWNLVGSSVTLKEVPNGTYQVYLYTWEDTSDAAFDIFVQGRQVQRDYHSGAAGQWKRLGPWLTNTSNNTIELRCSPGEANLSGIELWKIAD